MDSTNRSTAEYKEQTELTQLQEHQRLQESRETSTVSDVSDGFIDLGDPMKAVPDKYEYNYLLLSAFVLSIATVTFGNAALTFFGSDGKRNNTASWITLAYFMILLLVCVIVLAMARYSKKSGEKLAHSLNRLLTVKRPETVYDISQLHYAPLLFLISTLYCCILAIIEQTYFYNISVGYNEYCLTNITKSKCLVVGASFITTYQMMAAFVFFGLMQSVKCNESSVIHYIL